MYSIGYKLNFDNANPEEIEAFFNEYLTQFDRYEVKVTKRLLASGKMKVLLEVSERLAKGRYSFHLLKDVLSNSESFNMLLNLMEVLNEVEVSKKVYLITHIPYGNEQDCFGEILDISKKLPENYILLLENEYIEGNNEEYLKQINNICRYLVDKGIGNVGICLDIGHLLFGFSKENISEKNALKKLQEMSIIIYKVKELHIHDYFEKDHLKINDGIMDLTLVSKFLDKNNLNVPTIIEASVKLPDEGISQVEILKQILLNK